MEAVRILYHMYLIIFTRASQAWQAGNVVLAEYMLQRVIGWWFLFALAFRRGP
jgi:hypothetical protein